MWQKLMQLLRRKWIAMLAILIVVPTAMLALYRIWIILQPMQAGADFGTWKAPYYVAQKLKGVAEVYNHCEDLKDVIDPNIEAGHRNLCDLSRHILADVNNLMPSKAEIVEQSRSMYTIRVRNNGEGVCDKLILSFRDAKYVEMERGDSALISLEPSSPFIDINNVKSSELIVIRVWASCPINKQLPFEITREPSKKVFISIEKL